MLYSKQPQKTAPPSREREDLFPTSTVKTMSPSMAKDGQVCWQSPLEDQGSPAHASSAVRQTHYVYTLTSTAISLRLQGQGELMRTHSSAACCVVSDNEAEGKSD